MEKTYIDPELTVVELSGSDVITDSGDNLIHPTAIGDPAVLQ